MPGESQTPFPTQRTTFPFKSAPAPPAMVLQGFAGGSSAVPYRQSGPGSLVSPVFVTSLSPDWGFELFTAPKPQRYWSRRPQRPPSSGTRNVGSVKPGFWQHWFRMHPGAGCPGGEPQPGVPAQRASGFSHVTHALWLHVGAGSACAIVNTVLMPEPNGRTTPSAVAKVVIVQSWVTPSCPPQSASVLHGWKRFVVSGVLVWQSFGPGTATIWYVPGMP